MAVRLNAFLGLGDHLARAQGPIDVSSLQDELNIPQAGVSTSTFYNWLGHLEFQRAVTRADGALTVDRPRLMSFYAAHRLVRARPEFQTTTGLSGPELVEHLGDHGHRNVALGFLSAANEWAFMEPRRGTELYAGRETVRRLRADLPPGNRPLTVFAENWSELPRVPRGGVQTTGLFLTIVDCRAHPEGGAHASFLERELLEVDR